MMRILALFFLLVLFVWDVSAQTLSGISTRWNDSFVEWEIFAYMEERRAMQNDEEPEEELIGTFTQRWATQRDDWSEWDYELFGERGTIRAKWKDDPTQWELRSQDGSIVTMRTAWGKDLNEWRVTDNDSPLTFRSRWTNQWDEWLVDHSSKGRFYIHTLRRGDPRDWAIADELDESVSLPMRTALIFLAVFHSSPRM
jgi:hypothetical protein